MDRIEKAVSGDSRIRFCFAETTVASKALEARHRSGPAASACLAEALTAAALLSADTAGDEACVMLRMQVSGPIGGVLVEAAGDGGLRGFTTRKALDPLDAVRPVETAAAWGESGAVQVVFSNPGVILNQAVLNVNPPCMRMVLARYFNQSAQIPTACAVAVSAGDGVTSARGIMAQRMPDADREAFIRVLEAFEDGRVAQQLAGPAPHGGAAGLAGVFALPDMAVSETRPLRFACRCDRRRVLAVLETLSRQELESRVDEGTGQVVTCHMCGRSYQAEDRELREILNRKMS